MYLREHNNVILHIVCGDITDVSTDGDVFIIKTGQKSVADMLNEPANLLELKKAFEFFGYNKFEVRQSDKLLSDEDNIKILNKYFDGIVNVINKK